MHPAWLTALRSPFAARSALFASGGSAGSRAPRLAHGAALALRGSLRSVRFCWIGGVPCTPPGSRRCARSSQLAPFTRLLEIALHAV